MLASLHAVRRICELGTAYGVGTAWLESGARTGSTILTVERDVERAAAARELFTNNPAVEVVYGDWRVALDERPFDLVFSDGGPKRAPGDPELVAPLVRRHGVVVLDDWTPGFAKPDASRDIWLNNPSYRAQELQVGPTMSVILAVRLD